MTPNCMHGRKRHSLCERIHIFGGNITAGVGTKGWIGPGKHNTGIHWSGQTSYLTMCYHCGSYLITKSLN